MKVVLLCLIGGALGFGLMATLRGLPEGRRWLAFSFSLGFYALGAAAMYLV